MREFIWMRVLLTGVCWEALQNAHIINDQLPTSICRKLGLFTPHISSHSNKPFLRYQCWKLAEKTTKKTLIYSSINSRATLIDSVAYLLAYGKTFKNTACACYSSAAINRINTVYIYAWRDAWVWKSAEIGLLHITIIFLYNSFQFHHPILFAC